MAFLHKKYRKGEVYLSIRDTVREGKKVKQQHLYSLGKASDYSDSSLQKIGANLYVLGGGKLEDLLALSCGEVGRYNYGFPLIVKHLLRLFSLEDWLNSVTKAHKLSYSLFEVVVLLLCNRWSSPFSKLGVYQTQSDFIGVEALELQWLYRSLNYFSAHSDELQKHLFEKSRQLSKIDLSLVFYDVTTFYFDSELEIEGSLRQKGFGKDGKIGQTQVVLGLLLDQYRNPVGYELYEGNQYEGHTLSDSVAKLKKKYKIGKLTLVADTGMLNSANLEEINHQGYDFLLGERLKNLPQKIQQKLIDKSQYKTLTFENEGESVQILYITIIHQNRKILCTYSEKRAKKDKKIRNERLQKAEKLLKNPTQLQKKAKTFFLKTTDEQNFEIDEEKVRKSALYDGLKAISTSNLDMEEAMMLQQYKQLYKIEQSFRTFKTFLETRPMFHWTDERIKGHFAICYLSFALLSHLQQIFKKAGLPYSEEQIRRNLNQMQLSHIIQNQNHIYVRSKLEEDSKKYLDTLGLKTLKDVSVKSLIDSYLK